MTSKHQSCFPQFSLRVFSQLEQLKKKTKFLLVQNRFFFLSFGPTFKLRKIRGKNWDKQDWWFVCHEQDISQLMTHVSYSPLFEVLVLICFRFYGQILAVRYSRSLRNITDYGRPMKPFFHRNPKLLGLGGQFGQINFGALRGIFKQFISIHFGTCPCFRPLFLKKTLSVYIQNPNISFGLDWDLNLNLGRKQ